MVCIKGNKCRLFKNTTATAVQIPGNEIALSRAGLNQGRFSFKMDGKNIDLIAFSIGVFTDALKGVDIRFVGIGDKIAPIGERLRFINTIQEVLDKEGKATSIEGVPESIADQFYGCEVIHPLHPLPAPLPSRERVIFRDIPIR